MRKLILGVMALIGFAFTTNAQTTTKKVLTKDGIVTKTVPTPTEKKIVGKDGKLVVVEVPTSKPTATVSKPVVSKPAVTRPVVTHRTVVSKNGKKVVGRDGTVYQKTGRKKGSVYQATGQKVLTKNGVVLKKDGTPDKRYKQKVVLKKDGTKDKRYKVNK